MNFNNNKDLINNNRLSNFFKYIKIDYKITNY